MNGEASETNVDLEAFSGLKAVLQEFVPEEPELKALKMVNSSLADELINLRSAIKSLDAGFEPQLIAKVVLASATFYKMYFDFINSSHGRNLIRARGEDFWKKLPPIKLDDYRQKVVNLSRQVNMVDIFDDASREILTDSFLKIFRDLAGLDKVASN